MLNAATPSDVELSYPSLPILLPSGVHVRNGATQQAESTLIAACILVGKDNLVRGPDLSGGSHAEELIERGVNLSDACSCG